jgi:hypothetical protein
MVQQQVKAYRLYAFEYELTVRPSSGGWLGFIRDGSEGQISQVTDKPNTLDATKLVVCKYAQSLAAATGSTMDPCADTRDLWKEITLPAD